MKDTEGEARREVALFRYGLISEALHLPADQVTGWLKRQSQREHAIPGSNRRRVAVTTMRDWIRDYRRLGFDGLMPKRRQDLGAVRKMPPETVEILLATRRRNMDLSIRQIIDRVRSGGEVPDDVVLAASTVHRLFVREGLVRRRKEEPQQDLRRFAAKAAGQLWQSDVMHGPKVRDKDGRKRRTYLIALLDDATRLIPYAHFAFSESTAAYLVVLKEAIQRRGLPQRLYVDNGANFRSRQLQLICGRLGISLLHARPYRPQGKGKIERWFRTVREQMLSPLGEEQLPDLETLNLRFRSWLENEYHMNRHRGLEDGRTPLDHWALTCEHVRRPDPGACIDDLFLFEVVRKVSRSRTVSLDGRSWEVDAGMNGDKVTLRYDPSAPPGRPIKVVHEGRDAGLARPLDLHANARVKRTGQVAVAFRTLDQHGRKKG